jgi:transposase
MSISAPRTEKAHTFLNATQKQALIAAVASGMPQRQAAQEFGVHRNTVTMLMKSVKQYAHAANPLSKDWKDSALAVAQSAVHRGMLHESDPIGAANVALKLMHGIGYLTTSNQLQVDGNVNLQVSWGAVQEPDPEPALDVDHKQISDGASRE